MNVSFLLSNRQTALLLEKKLGGLHATHTAHGANIGETLRSIWRDSSDHGAGQFGT